MKKSQDKSTSIEKCFNNSNSFNKLYNDLKRPQLTKESTEKGS